MPMNLESEPWMELKLWPFLKNEPSSFLKKVKAAYGNWEMIFVTTHDDKFYVSGKNCCGRLGLGLETKTVQRWEEIVAFSSKKITDIRFTYTYSVVLTADGDVYASGDNKEGHLGLGHKYAVTGYQQVHLGGAKVTALACSPDHVMCCTTEGHVYTWGHNDKGELGYETEDWKSSLSPQRVTALPANVFVVAVYTRGDCSYALTSDEQVFGWGSNYFGQLGTDDFTNYHPPQRIILEGNKRVKQISCGEFHVLFLTVDGVIYASGSNKQGQCGIPDADAHKPVLLQRVTGIPDPVLEIHCRKHSSMCRTTRNVIYLWGTVGRVDISVPVKTSPAHPYKSLMEASIHLEHGNFIPWRAPEVVADDTPPSSKASSGDEGAYDEDTTDTECMDGGSHESGRDPSPCRGGKRQRFYSS